MYLVHTLQAWMAINPCHAEYYKMLHPLLTVSQSDYMIQVVDTNSYTKW